LAVALLPRAAQAQHRGTHLIAEVGGGYSVPVASDLDGGLSLAATLGVGGKWKGFPPRFYLAFGTRWASYSGVAVQSPTGRASRLDVSDVELYGGLRVLIPAGWILLVTMEGDFGTNLHDETVRRTGDPSLVHSEWAPLFSLSGGLQARWHRRASLGLRATYSWRFLDPDRVTRAAGTGIDDEGARTSIELTHTWHF
jgi:hypothetical protein